MRISDWSSDVCSSDLGVALAAIAEHGDFLARDQGQVGIGVVINFHSSAHFRHSGEGRNPVPAHANFWIPACARSEEHTSELQSLMRISYAVFCLKKNNQCE